MLGTHAPGVHERISLQKAIVPKRNDSGIRQLTRGAGPDFRPYLEKKDHMREITYGVTFGKRLTHKRPVCQLY